MLRIGIVLIAFVVLAHFGAVFGDIARPLHIDEGEYLHTAWLMDQGRVIYRDFMQDHPPFLFQFMNLFNPREPGGIYPLLDIRTWTEIGRILAGVCGAVVLISAAMLAYLAARSALAALVALAYALQEPVIWERGLADLRSDPFAMAMLWGGALLIVMTFRRDMRRHDALLSGIGIALVAGAALLNPKWPFESVVLGVVYLMTLWRSRVRGWRVVVVSLLPTVIVLGVAAAMLLSVTTFAEYVYFTFQLKTGIQKNVMEAGIYGFREMGGWWTILNAGDVVIVVVAALLILAAQRFELVRNHIDVPRLAILVALCLASIAELPFFQPYTLMWPQYRVSYVIAAGILYGVVIAVLYGAFAMVMTRRAIVVLVPLAVALLMQWMLVTRLLQRSESSIARWVIAACIVGVWIPAIAAFLHALRVRAIADAERLLPFASVAAAFASLAIVGLSGAIAGRIVDPDKWVERAVLQHKLRAGERVWMSPRSHPIAAHDASYFYYGFGDVTAGSLPHAMKGHPFLPRMSEKDLPPCRISRGLDQQTRFIELGPWLDWYPDVSRCVVTLLDRGALSATPHLWVFEVRRPNDGGPRYQPHKKARLAMQRLALSARRSAAAGRGVLQRMAEKQ